MTFFVFLQEHHMKKQTSEISRPTLNSKFALYPHQEGMVSFMVEKEKLKSPPIKGGIINAIMGAGKTLSSLYHIVNSEDNVASLVICPKSVLNVWVEDIAKFYGKSLEYLVLHPEYNDIKNLTRNDLLKYDVVITTYEVCQAAYEESGYTFSLPAGLKKRLPPNPKAKGKSVVFSITWPRIFCDESHTAFLNPRTKTFKAMMSLSSDNVWCLSGTPVKNSSIDLLAQFWVCGYTRITSEKDWEMKYLAAITAEKLDSHILAITMKDTSFVLSKKVVHKTIIIQNTHEHNFYQALLRRINSVYEGLAKGKGTYANVLALFTRLRQTCIAPHLVTHMSERNPNVENEEEVDIDDLFSDDIRKYISSRNLSGLQSSKIQKTVEIIRKIIKLDQKVVVFSKFVCALDLLKEALDKSGITKVDQYDGTVKGKERDIILDRFKRKASHHVLLMSYGTGSVGLNITEANHVILLEPFWHDVMHEQAISRVWRNGQKSTVHVHQLIVKGSIEEKILKICERKKKLTEELLDDATTLKELKKIEKAGLTKAHMKEIISQDGSR